MKDRIIHAADKALADRVLAGERAAFEEFFRIYYSRLVRFARSHLSVTEDAEDLVQQTLARAFRYMHTYKGEASLYTWVCQICRNLIRTWYARNQERQHQTRSFDQSPELLASIESIASALDGSPQDGAQEAIVEIVQLALDALPNRYSEALKMKYQLGLSLREIAERSGDSPTAVQSLLARARQSFREAFDLLHNDRKLSAAKAPP